MIQPIATERAFREIKEGGAGYVLILDKHTGDHIHIVPCIHIKLENFIEKVILNNREHGHYFWSDNSEEFLERWLNAIPCEFRKADYETL
jgi:hypothetical protein